MKRLENETQYDYKLRRELNELETKIKLKGRWFWKSLFVLMFGENKYDKGESNGTYFAPEIPKKISFTEQLRNERGYSEFLSKKHKTV